MKTAISTLIIASVVLFFNISDAYSQKKTVIVKEKGPRSKVVVVKHKKHISKVKVYHPRWAPRATFHHRWVYFPRYNFYWDNFHDVYVIRTGTVWVVRKDIPDEVKKVDLSKEKSVELSEDADVNDSIQDKNAEHQKEYNAE